MDYFLQDIAKYLYRKNEGDFQDTILVFPNRRARLFFNHFIAEQINKPLWAPRYDNITDFIQKLSGLQLADSLTLIFKLYKVFKEVTHTSESFDSLYFFIETILADFNDIDKNQVQAESLFANLSNIKELEDYTAYLSEEQIRYISEFWDICVKARPSDEKKDFVTLWDALFRIYKKFGETLENDNIAYEGRLYLRALQQLQTDTSIDELHKQVVFIGFNALNRSEEQLFSAFKKYGNALFFWDYSEHYITNKLHEAGFFLRDYIKRFPQPDDFAVSPHCKPANQKVYSLAVPSNISQAKVIQKGIELTGNKQIKTPLQTALVLADENLLLPVANSLPNQIDKVNISMGYPITDTSIYSLLVSLSELHSNRRLKKEGTVGYLFYHRDFFKIFQHEVLHEVYDSEDFSKFIAECRKTNRVYIDSIEIPGNHPTLKAILEPLENARYFGKYIRNIVEVMAQKLISESSESKRFLWEIEIYHAIHKILMRYEALLEEADVDMNFTTVTRLFKKVLQGMSVPFSGEPLEGLQVMGILETRTLDFENIVILSMNEGKFPKTSSAPSLIPYTLRKGFGLPTQEHQDAIFGYYFYRLLHRARKVVLVYNTKTEGMQKGEPSRYIQQLKYTSEHDVQEISMGYRIAPIAARKLVGPKTEHVTEGLKKYWRSDSKKFLSPSALSCYLQCKLRFYFRYIEEISEPGEIAENVESNVFGSILHKAIHLIYKDYIGRELNKSELDAMMKDNNLLEQAIDRAYAEEYFHSLSSEKVDYKGEELIIREVILKYIKRILAYDSKHTPFIIRSLETKYECTLPVSNSDINIRLGGVIDRLDEYKHTVRIIDYKTGTPKNDFNKLETLFQNDSDYKTGAIFQSLMYSWLMVQHQKTQAIQPHLFFVREMDTDGLDTRIINKEKGTGVVNSMEQYTDEFGERLNQLIDDIFNSQLPFDQTAKIKTCEYCSFKSICLREKEL